ncbi:MAG: hypothetical protein QM607_12665 [Microbacterium sp.]
MILDPTGPLCPRGHRGCATSMLTSASNVSVISAALGRLLATIANVAMVRRIQVSGDGVCLADQYGDLVRGELDRDRDPDAHEVVVGVRHTTFFDWAESAAAAAIQRYTLNTL